MFNTPRHLRKFTGLVALLFLVMGGCGGSNSTTSPGHTGADTGGRPAGYSAAQDGVQAYTPTGRIVADSGFRPQVNGFSFANYPPPTPLPQEQDLTVAEMIDIFGANQVCTSQRGGCTPTPTAETVMEQLNGVIQNGHCFGFSLASLMMFEGLVQPSTFNAAAVPDLTLDYNAPLQGLLAESWAVQTVAPAIKKLETPNKLLTYLIKHLNDRNDTYTLTILKRRGKPDGHAITPYEVEDRGGGRFAVLVYDNNFPATPRAVLFDQRTDSWSYYASANAADPVLLYDGRGKQNEPRLYSTDVAVRSPACPFCSVLGPGSAGSTAGSAPPLTPPGYQQISLSSASNDHGHLVITDAAGRRTGIVDSSLVNQIPGARVKVPILAGTLGKTPEPQYQIPTDTKFTISLNGDALNTPDTESVSIVGPSYSAIASNIDLRPSQQEQLRLRANGTVLSYRTGSGHPQLPDLQIGLVRPGSDFRFSVSTPPLVGGSTVTAVAKPEAKQLRLDAGGVKNSGKYSLAVTQLHPTGKQTSHGRTVRVPRGGSAHLSLPQ